MLGPPFGPNPCEGVECVGFQRVFVGIQRHSPLQVFSSSLAIPKLDKQPAIRKMNVGRRIIECQRKLILTFCVLQIA